MMFSKKLLSLDLSTCDKVAASEDQYRLSFIGAQRDLSLLTPARITVRNK